MNKSVRRALLACMASICIGHAWAQADVEASASADGIVQAGLQVLGQIDAGQGDAVWNGTAAFVKSRMTQQQFIADTLQARKTVGQVTRRDWASVTRIRFVDGSIDPPPGMYANVDYAAHLGDGRTVFEKLSLRLEPAGWRLTGYVPRQQQ